MTQPIKACTSVQNGDVRTRDGDQAHCFSDVVANVDVPAAPLLATRSARRESRPRTSRRSCVSPDSGISAAPLIWPPLALNLFEQVSLSRQQGSSQGLCVSKLEVRRVGAQPTA